jgi:hypothetical protein
MQPAFGKLTGESIRLMGGAATLREDELFYEMNLSTFRPGAGMGITGPAVLLPALAAAAWLSCRRTRSNGDGREANCLRALTFFAFVSFFVFFLVLRTQQIGTLRLMLSCVATAMPLAWCVARHRIGAAIASAAAVSSLLLNVAHGASFAANRCQIPALAKLAALKRTPPETVEILRPENVSEKLDVREPYTNRELYALALPRVPPGSTVGIVGQFFSEGFPCFGAQYSNAVVSLNDCRSSRVEVPPANVQFIVLEHRDPDAIDKEVFQDFERVFAAKKEGEIFFEFYERKRVTK